jgi:hypothetical protein
MGGFHRRLQRGDEITINQPTERNYTMAYLGGEFDANNVEPSAPRENLPPDDYVMHIKASEMKPTKKGNGQYLLLDLEVLEGPFKGRHVFDRLNLDNPNETAVEIANKTLSAICHAVGVLRVKDSNQLHNRKMIVTVDVEKQEGYSPSNAVKGYKPLDGAQAADSGVEEAKPVVKRPAWNSK